MKRILFHSINHTGLGHLNRSIAVAQLLKANLPGVQVLFLVEGGEDFIEPTGFPWIMVPGHNQTSEAENIEYITRTTIEVYRPDLAVYETVLLEPIHAPIKQAGIREVLMGNMGGLLRNQIRDLSASASELDLLLVLQQREDLTPDDQALIDQYKGKKNLCRPACPLEGPVCQREFAQEARPGGRKQGYFAHLRRRRIRYGAPALEQRAFRQRRDSCALSRSQARRRDRAILRR